MIKAALGLLLASLLVVSCDLNSCAFNREGVVYSIGSSGALNRSVDPERGADNADCLNGSGACRTLYYALGGVQQVRRRYMV